MHHNTSFQVKDAEVPDTTNTKENVKNALEETDKVVKAADKLIEALVGSTEPKTAAYESALDQLTNSFISLQEISQELSFMNKFGKKKEGGAVAPLDLLGKYEAVRAALSALHDCMKMAKSLLSKKR